MKFCKVPLLVALIGLSGVSFVALAQQKKKDDAKNEDKVAEAIPEKALATPKKQRKMLVFSVTRGYRHGSIDIGNVAIKMLGEKTGAYEAVVSNDLANFEADKIKEYDAICFLNTTMEVFLPAKGQWDKMSDEEKKAATEKDARLKENLLNFVKSGGGFVGIHAASDTFYKWPEYGEMLGAYFNGHPWRHNTDVSIMVEKGKEKNPIVAGLNGEPLNFKEEIYQFKDPYDSSKLNMLLRLDPEKSDKNVSGIKRDDKDFGVSWTKSYGKGRVFYCSLGHNDYIYYNPKVLGVYLAGIQWAFGDLEIE